MTPARELTAAVTGLLLGPAVVLLAAGETWASGRVSQGEGLPVAAVALTGHDLAPPVTGLALLGLAAVAALVATRAGLRRAVGAVVAAAGAAVVALSAGAGADAAGRAAADVPGGAAVTLDLRPWPWVAVLGGVILLAAGLLTMVRGPRWPSMSGRYEAPRSSPAVATVDRADSGAAQAVGGRAATPEELWRAIDRGDDPTT